MISLQEVQPSEIKQRKAYCPMCGKESLLVAELCYELPNFGNVYLFSANCQNCGYKHTDVMEITPHQDPSRFTIKVEKPEDLNHIVVRSSYASIKMPELGITITPGPYAQGVVTTIEGFLHRAREIVEFLFSSELNERQKRRCLQILKKVNAAIEGKETFTFIIEDPSGLSIIVPKEGLATKIIKEPLEIEG
ncbi:MAG: ZPR1 zinc finger domain-containing protein [Candidatus Nezhaarchaeales archaeon]